MATRVDLTSFTLSEVADLIGRGDVSPVEVTDQVLERIEAIDSRLNSYIRVSAETARIAAEGAERWIEAGYRLGPLHGVPIALKDVISVRGEVCSSGSKVLSEFVPAEDATIAANLRAAGAIFLGRLNMHEFAFGTTTENPHYGPTRNPWDTHRSPGGSSGGSGAAVAARLCYGAVGTDTACSVRLPAAFNGITGIRPTIGRVSNHGIVPLAWTLDAAGPMCRTAEDCALMLSVMAGPDARDPQTVPAPVPDYRAELGRGLEGMRLAVIENFTFEGLQEGVRTAMEAAADTLRSGGAELRQIRLQNLEPSVSALVTIDFAEPSAYHGEWLRERPGEYGDDVRAKLQAGNFYLATHYIQAQRYRSLLREELTTQLRDVDAIITPTVPITAPPVGATEITLGTGQVLDNTLDVISAVMRYAALPALTGMPALSVPCGFSDGGLPVGMQIIGNACDESTVLRIGHAYQQLTDWHTREPEP